MSDELRLNALIGILKDWDEGELAKLRQTHNSSTAAEILAGTVTLGGKADTKFESGSSSLDSTMLMAELTAKALSVATSRMEPSILELNDRLKRAKRLRLTSVNVGSIAAIGVIASLATSDQKILAMIPALLNFGAIVVLRYAEHLEGIVHGGKQSLIEVYEELVTTIANAEGVQRKLNVMIRTGGIAAGFEDIVREANDAVARLRRWELLLWGHKHPARSRQ